MQLQKIHDLSNKLENLVADTYHKASDDQRAYMESVDSYNYVVDHGTFCMHPYVEKAFSKLEELSKVTYPEAYNELEDLMIKAELVLRVKAGA